MSDGIELITAIGPPEGQERKIYKSLGFINVPQKLQPLPIPQYVNRFTEELPEADLNDINSWYIQLGDFDVV